MIQKQMIDLANNACLAISYIKYLKPDAGLPYIMFQLSMAVYNGIVDYDGYVKDANRLLQMCDLRGTKYNVTKVADNPGKKCIAQFYNPSTGFSHFAIVDENNNIIYDPLEDSVTCREGYIISYRKIEEIK